MWQIPTCVIPLVLGRLPRSRNPSKPPSRKHTLSIDGPPSQADTPDPRQSIRNLMCVFPVVMQTTRSSPGRSRRRGIGDIPDPGQTLIAAKECQNIENGRRNGVAGQGSPQWLGHLAQPHRSFFAELAYKRFERRHVPDFEVIELWRQIAEMDDGVLIKDLRGLWLDDQGSFKEEKEGTSRQFLEGLDLSLITGMAFTSRALSSSVISRVSRLTTSRTSSVSSAFLM